MLLHKIYADRWFTWTLVFLLVTGISMIAYLQWVNLDLYTTNTLLLVF